MRRAVRPVLLLLAILSLMAGGAYVVITRTTRGWFEADLQLRSKLAVLSARQSLLRHWSADPKGLQATLADITRDERIMAAAACSEVGDLVAATADYPLSFSCRSVFERLAQELGATAKRGAFGAELPSGRVQVNVHRLLPDATTTDNDVVSIGRVILVHDLGVFERREATTRRVILLGFLLVAIAAAGVTLLMTRLTWRDWNEGLRRALTGNSLGGGEFAPLLGDVRNLVERLSREPDSEARGPWSPERLRATLHQHLEGERVVLLANREPYIHERSGDTIRVMHPASGLVSALEPVMRACSGVWVAHGSGSADRETVDAHDRVRVPPGETVDTYLVRRVWLTDAEESGYYYGFSNEGLWPLCHVAHTRPLFRADDWAQYVAVNRKFADAVCREVDTDDPIVLVQDYHFALAPKMIRERLPKATIITFWHIPWPNAERVGICPWRDELITGLLGSSIIGFHTQQHCNNFRDAVDTYIESRIDREHNAVIQGDRRTLIRPYPISVEWPIHWLAGLPSVDECRREVRAELGLADDATIGVGIDRLDYTKGIEERLRAVDELLTHHPAHRGKFTFVQLAAPSRTKIPHYRDLNLRIEQVAAEINAKWGSGSYRPILLLRAHHEPPTVFRYYRAAELCYVSSLHDGMNLVAKEFVAAREDERGVLVLSQFTGAARDLTEALIVNPYDVREAGDAMAAALRMGHDEQRVRMQSMRRLVAQFNVYRWAGRMLVDAAELRRRERTAARLSERQRPGPTPVQGKARGNPI